MFDRAVSLYSKDIRTYLSNISKSPAIVSLATFGYTGHLLESLEFSWTSGELMATAIADD